MTISVLGEALMDCVEQPDGSLRPLMGGSPFNLARAAALQREGLKPVLPATLVDDQPLFEAVALLVSVDAWVRLRSLQGLSASLATDTIKRAIQKLVF